MVYACFWGKDSSYLETAASWGATGFGYLQKAGQWVVLVSLFPVSSLSVRNVLVLSADKPLAILFFKLSLTLSRPSCEWLLVILVFSYVVITLLVLLISSLSFGFEQCGEHQSRCIRLATGELKYLFSFSPCSVFSFCLLPRYSTKLATSGHHRQLRKKWVIMECLVRLSIPLKCALSLLCICSLPGSLENWGKIEAEIFSLLFLPFPQHKFA